MELSREIVLAGAPGKLPKTSLPRRWRVLRTTYAALRKQDTLTPITVVAPDLTTPRFSVRSLAKELQAKPAAVVGTPFFLFWMPQASAAEVADYVKLLRLFAKPERVQVARTQAAYDAVMKVLIAQVEVFAERAASADPPAASDAPRPSPLDNVRAIVAATKDLRGPTGRLSVPAVATAYGVSVSQLATWLGRSRQALHKAPDADSVQRQLEFFERIARLRAVLEEPDDFRRWLRMPNEALSGKTPLGLLKARRFQVLADLVDDMLTGSPS